MSVDQMGVLALQRALTQAGEVLDQVAADDLAKPTPCSEWDVRALANHMTGVCLMFGRAAQGEAIEGRPTFTDLIGDDPGAAYVRAAEANREGWNSPGALERTL